MRKYIFLIIYRSFAQFLPASGSRFFGKQSMYIRRYCCKHIFKYCGKDVNIERMANFGKGFQLEIGDYSGLGINCFVPDNIKIGKFVMMGPNCHVLAQNHDISDISKPMCFAGYVKKDTIIEDDVWIGLDVIFTPGRTVRKGSVIAAGCVLSKDFPEYSIIGGNPSKIIRCRT
jgi:maltose O-acetyltransferase